MGRRVLIIDDEPAIRFGVSEFLRHAGYEVGEAAGCKEAEAQFALGSLDAVLLDYRLPDGDSFEVVSSFKRADPGLPVVVLTALASIELAVEAIKRGADHFLTKPIDLVSLEQCIHRLMDVRRSRNREIVDLRRREAPLDPFLGASPSIAELREQASRLIDAESPILILGETGTGKGVLARWLHEHGPRKQEPFVDFNCAGLSKDLFESELFGHERGAFTGAVATKAGLLDVGNRGTFFLDEIGDVDAAVQPKLLKVVEEKRFRRLGDVRDRHVDVRLIAATHRDLVRMREDGTFRDDLYFRIAALPLKIPPLRERREDILPLAEAMLASLGAARGATFALHADARQALLSYRWPGNAREMRNVLERGVLLSNSGSIDRRHLGFEVTTVRAADAAPSALTLAEVERIHVLHVLDEEQGHVESASRRLDIPRSSLYQKLKEYGIEASTFQKTRTGSGRN